MTSAELLQQQLNATTRRRKPKGVKPDLQAGQAYNVALQRIVRDVNKDVKTYVLPAVKSVQYEYTADGWPEVIAGALDFVKARWSSPQFKALLLRIARSFVTTADNTNRARTERDIGINVYTGQQEMLDYIDASIYDNVRLIESIPAQYLTQVDSIVMTNVRAGGRPSAIAELLQKQLGVTERRAKVIARDQTAKLNGDLNKMRQTSAGFEYFRWNTSHDERVRDRHEHIGERVTAYGKGIYRWDNPPLSDRGTPIICGQDFQCRCVGEPVSNEEVKENQSKGLTNPNVKR